MLKAGMKWSAQSPATTRFSLFPETTRKPGSSRLDWKECEPDARERPTRCSRGHRLRWLRAGASAVSPPAGEEACAVHARRRNLRSCKARRALSPYCWKWRLSPGEVLLGKSAQQGSELSFSCYSA